jgi:trigger factor
MNIFLKNNDALSGILKIEIEKSDYEGKVEKSLREMRQKANIPGFRKGMVPVGMIRKMYGKHALADELNAVTAKALTDYIKENNIMLLGEPIPNETEQKQIDLDNDEVFEFSFDLAFSPEINIDLSKEDKLTLYNIIIDDKVIDEHVELLRQSYGSYDNVEKAEVNDMIKGDLFELEEKEPKTDGIIVEDAIIKPSNIKGKIEQKKFLGATVEKTIIFNPYKAFKGDAAELSSLLKIDKENVKDIKGEFSFTIKEITRNNIAEINQELFDKVFGENSVKDENEFREKIRLLLSEQSATETKYRYSDDLHQLIMQKTENVQFADEILKRWLLAASENKTIEDIEREYPLIKNDLRYQLAKNELVKKLEIKINDSDVEDMAKQVATIQFQQYGMTSVPEELASTYAKKLLDNQENARSIVERAIEEKLAEAVKEIITVEVKEVSKEEYNPNSKEETKKEETKEEETKKD